MGKDPLLGDRSASITLAVDASGNPTDDPVLAKTLLPAAGPRGYGLALLCSILAGPLVGGKMPLHKTRSPEAEGSEHGVFAYVGSGEDGGVVGDASVGA